MFGFAFRVTAIAVAALFPGFGHAANTDPVAPETAEAPASIEVNAKQLYAAHNGIQAQTGASTHRIDAAAIAATSKDDNTPLNDVIMQAPEVAQSSFGQSHSHGEHNGLQYRLSDIILPEGPNVFGESLNPRRIASVGLITGALSADYRLRTAGIIDLKTKGDSGGSVSLYRGSHDKLPPSVKYAGSSGKRALQSDAAYEFNDSHTLGGSVYVQADHSVRATTSQVLRMDSYVPDS